MARVLPILLLASVMVASNGQWLRDPKDPFGLLKKNDCPLVGPCLPMLYKPTPPPPIRGKRSVADDVRQYDDTTIINSELPSDIILQELQGRYISELEQAEIVENGYQMEGSRQKRGVKAVVIRVCNRKTGRCRFIIIYRRS